MIVKKIENPKKSASKATRISALTNYIREPSQKNIGEKCIYSGARGFITDNPRSQTAEMIALSQDAVRSKDTINHYVLSWREGEQPSYEQIEESVSIFMKELGLKDHQAIYGLHADTNNIHLHLVINRVHPETVKCVEINKGFDIEAAHKAIARIELAHGWQREQHGRYQILENGELGREHINTKKLPEPRQKQKDTENRTGEKSAERMAIEYAAPIIKRAQTWEQLHRELAEQGMRYEKTGSGAVIFFGDIGVKASSVDRDAGFTKLQKRLGAYQSQQQDLKVVQREAEPIKQDMHGWHEYIKGRKVHYADKNLMKLEQDKRHKQEWEALSKQQKIRRTELLQGDWKGRGDALNALRSIIAQEQAIEKALLKDKHKKERDQYRNQFRPYPDFEQWQRMQNRHDLAEQWRHRASEPQGIQGDREAKPKRIDIRDYRAEMVGRQVEYSKEGEIGDVAFVDKGNRIDVYAWHDEDAVLAALQLSAQKWGSITVSGNDEYKLMCVKLAAEHGFKIINPELQDSINQERILIKNKKIEVIKSEQLKQFEHYAYAVNAERYRVTSIKVYKNGSKKTFFLDKKNSVNKEFTDKEIEKYIEEMQLLQKRGENIYYTPLSDGKHHILIDDINKAKLDKLIKDGYKPAVLLETSPGNYQVIITIRKLGTVHDKDVGNRLTEYLNREYGNPNLSGGIHSHRAPGYENRKPNNQREDGSYPQVRLLKAERRECSNTLNLSIEMDTDYQRQVDLNAWKSEKKEVILEYVQSNSNEISAYYWHRRDILSRQQGGEIDLSRLDAMIAVRMRVTGYDQSSIEETIFQCAPTTRQNEEKRNWGDYAQRTAQYAYSVAGDRQIEKLAKYHEQWSNLEEHDVSNNRLKL